MVFFCYPTKGCEDRGTPFGGTKAVVPCLICRAVLQAGSNNRACRPAPTVSDGDLVVHRKMVLVSLPYWKRMYAPPPPEQWQWFPLAGMNNLSPKTARQKEPALSMVDRGPNFGGVFGSKTSDSWPQPKCEACWRLYFAFEGQRTRHFGEVTQLAWSHAKELWPRYPNLLSRTRSYRSESCKYMGVFLFLCFLFFFFLWDPQKWCGFPFWFHLKTN